MPATDEVYRLQNGEDPECRCFQAAADLGHYRRPGQTRQGTYILTPGGTLLASGNSISADRTLKTINHGLARWRGLTEQQRLEGIADCSPKHRWEQSYPEGGLILWMTVRDLPDNLDPSEKPDKKWNQDAVWFTKQEARRWIAADLSETNAHSVPSNLVERLARCHFIDVTRGQAPPFQRADVEYAEITTKIVQRQANLVTISMEGRTRAEAPYRNRFVTQRGVETDLEGRATFDTQSGQFTEFELVAIGQRWGRARFNNRARDQEPSPIGYVLRIDPAAPKIAPALIYEYHAKWVRR